MGQIAVFATGRRHRRRHNVNGNVKAMRMPFSINVFLYEQEDQGERRYLIFRRNERKDRQLPSFWQGVTGAAKEGETLEEATRREILEETGIAPEQISKTDFSYEYPIKAAWKPSYPSDATRITEYVFCAKVAGLPTLSMEHKESKWVSFQEGLKMLTFGMNAQSLECVESFLKQRETRM